MALDQFINHSENNQVRNFHSGKVFRGRSKTLMCLHKILRIISSLPPPETPKEPSLSSVIDVLEPSLKALRGEDNRALFDIDLNIGVDSPVSPPLVTEKSGSTAENGGASACSGVVGELVEIDSPVLSAIFSTAEKSPVGECDLKEAVNLFRRNTPEIEDGGEAEIVGEKAIDTSEVTSMEVQSSEMNNDRVSAESIGKEESKVEEVTEEKHEPELHRSKGGLDLQKKILQQEEKGVAGESSGSGSQNPMLEMIQQQGQSLEAHIAATRAWETATDLRLTQMEEKFGKFEEQLGKFEERGERMEQAQERQTTMLKEVMNQLLRWKTSSDDDK